MDRPPCETCPVLAMCRIKESIECEILTEFLLTRKDIKSPKNGLKESLGAEILIWNPDRYLVTVIRDKDVANDLRNAGKDKK